MQTVKRRNAQTAHISLHHTTVSKSSGTNATGALVSQRHPDRLMPRFSTGSRRSRNIPRRVSALVRFGEAVFTEAPRWPQEGKMNLPGEFS